jgi:hypothetical protein
VRFGTDIKHKNHVLCELMLRTSYNMANSWFYQNTGCSGKKMDTAVKQTLPVHGCRIAVYGITPSAIARMKRRTNGLSISRITPDVAIAQVTGRH